MSYKIRVIKNGARERYVDAVFATRDSALDFGLRFLPEDVDFYIDEIESLDFPPPKETHRTSVMVH